MSSIQQSLFVEGQNCKVVSHADRLGVTTHGNNYFRALFHAFHSAKKRIFIMAWDIDSQVELIRGEEAKNQKVTRLGETLDRCCKNNPDLQVYILDWDYTQIFAHAREILPKVKFGLKTSSRVHFQLHKAPVAGASHHQKIVIIDNQCAFCGGIDITKGRWDTPQHLPRDPRRTDQNDNPQRPFHDMQFVLQGEAVRELEKMAIAHWKDATNETLPVLSEKSESDYWPKHLTQEFNDIPVAISRTISSENERQQVFESEQLFVDMIQNCKETLYIENQYFTSQKITEAIEKVLRSSDPPEIIVILTPYSDGWLAQQTMDILRSRMLHRLRSCDHRGVLSFWYPFHPDLDGQEINLHAKLTICDDRYVRIGSTNISNRSMRLDTECDLTADASADQLKRHQILEFRTKCLGEHLAMDYPEVSAYLRENSITELIQSRVSNSAQCLRPIDDHLGSPEEEDLVMPEIYDPTEPIDIEKLSVELLPLENPEIPKTRLFFTLGSILTIFGLAFLWRWTPISDHLSPGIVIEQLSQISSLPFIPLIATMVLTLAMSVMIPLTLLVIVSVFVFGAPEGLAYALISAVLSSSFSFWLGRVMGTRGLYKIAGERILSIGKTLGKRGFLSSMAMRLIPVAQFTVVNLAAGASPIRWRDFIAGSILGQIPGILILAIGVDRFKASLDDPRFSIIFSSIALLTALVLLMAYASQKLRKKIGG